MTTTVFDLVGAIRTNPKKSKFSYDGSNRLEYIYEADPMQVDNGPCLVTRFSYVGATSQIAYSLEYVGQWDSAWEVF